jgi:hypothetical protein
MLRDVSEAALGILAGLDQMVQDGTFTAISHGVSLFLLILQ